MNTASWTFLTNHAHVLLCLSRDPNMRLRDLAERIGITERAVHRIIGELVEAGYLAVDKDGRRNHYIVHGELPLRHPVEAHAHISDLIRLLDIA